MRVFHLSTGPTLILCVVLWPIIQLSAVFISQRMPSQFFRADHYFFRSHAWEKEGQIYQHWFQVKRWKQHLPDGASFTGKRSYKKRYLSDFSSKNLAVFLTESARGELAHWLAIWPFIIFSLFVEPYVVVIMLIYALAVNVPCIIAQRYNRPRIRKILFDRERQAKEATSALHEARS